MNFIRARLIKMYGNSIRTNNSISWVDVKNYISTNFPELLDDKKWKSVSEDRGLGAEFGLQGYYGFALVKGIEYYFVQDFFNIEMMNILEKIFQYLQLLRLTSMEIPFQMLNFINQMIMLYK